MKRLLGIAALAATLSINAGCNDAIYSVIYDGNGSTAGTVPVDAQEYAADDTAMVLGNSGSLERTGYDFCGWNTGADGTGQSYNSGDSLTVTADVKLYAVWHQKTVYAVGDVGPSGVGIVFYITDDGTHGLEAAPANWYFGQDADPKVIWYEDHMQTPHETPSGSTNCAIGDGADNTLAALANKHYAHAAVLCDEYNGGLKTDWFLPSRDELVELYSQRAVVGGFTAGWYYSSSIGAWKGIWACNFADGSTTNEYDYGTLTSIRPVREF